MFFIEEIRTFFIVKELINQKYWRKYADNHNEHS